MYTYEEYTIRMGYGKENELKEWITHNNVYRHLPQSTSFFP